MSGLLQLGYMQFSASAVAGVIEIKYSKFPEDINSEIFFGKVTMYEDLKILELVLVPPGTLICICSLIKFKK